MTAKLESLGIDADKDEKAMDDKDGDADETNEGPASSYVVTRALNYMERTIRKS